MTAHKQQHTPKTQVRPLVQLQALLVFVLGLFLLISLLSHNPQDSMPRLRGGGGIVFNYGGRLGATLSENLFTLFGKAAYVLPFLLLAFAVPLFRFGSAGDALRQSAPLLLLFGAISLLLATGNSALSSGGIAGKILAAQVKGLAGGFGAWSLGVAMLGAFLVLVFREQVARLLQAQPQAVRQRKKDRTRNTATQRRVLFQDQPGEGLEERPLHNGTIFKPAVARSELMQHFKQVARQGTGSAPFVSRVLVEGDAPPQPLFTRIRVPAGEMGPDTDHNPETSPDEEARPLIADPVLDEPHMDRPFTDEEQNTIQGDEDLEQELAQYEGEQVQAPSPSRRKKVTSSYRMPDRSLLIKNHQSVDEATRRHMTENARLLEQTFAEFNIEAQVTDICRGPVITRFEISIPPGVKLTRVVALQDNIALNLAAASVRIEAPIPGKSAIGIEIPNKTRSLVTLRDILESDPFQNNRAKLPIALGQTVSGQAIVADLASMPHLIIAGTTGSGKSVCVNAIICSVLFRMAPQRVRFILVDPKYVELAPYNGIPHLLTPVINRPREAVVALKWLVGEMQRRYQAMQQMGARNLESFNEKVREEGDHLDPDLALEPLPYLVVVIDELADLMILAAKEIEDSISRLAAMSRAVGIHLIFATQRPSVDVLTGVIKNNFPARIAFQVASSTDSRTILDSKGADKLLGKGDSLFVGPGCPTPMRVQGAFLSEEEVDKTTEYLRSLGEPEYNMDILEPGNIDNEDENDGDGDGESDPLYQDAVELVLASKKASASYIQRRLKVGYNRAARMIEQMEMDGIVGPPQGSKPREILTSAWQ